MSGTGPNLTLLWIHPFIRVSSWSRGIVCSRHKDWFHSPLDDGRAQKICPIPTTLKPASEQSLDNFWSSDNFSNRCPYSCNRFPCRSSTACTYARGGCVRISSLSSWPGAFGALDFSTALWPTGHSSIISAAVDTKLIDGDDHLEEQLNVLRTAIAVYWLLSSSLAFQVSSLQGTGTSEYWMTGSCEVQQQFLCSSVPRSIWFAIVSSVPLLFRSRPQERPMTARESFSILLKFSLNYFHIIHHFLLHPIQCRYTLTWRWSCLWSSLVHTAILPSSVESDWGFPLWWILGKSSLEFHLLSINSIQFFGIASFQKPLSLPLPGFNRIVSHFPQTKHRVGEDIDFGNGLLISSTVQQACRYKPQILEITWAYVSGFRLTTDQLFRFSEKLSHCLQMIILYKSAIHVIIFSEPNRCSKSGIHEHSPNRQIHVQIFHRIARSSSMDFPDHGEDGFHVRCARRYLEVVVPCRFCILLTFLVNWRTGSVCKRLFPSFTVLGNKFTFVVPSLSLRISGVFWIFFFLMRRFPRCFSINPPRYASVCRTWEVDAASNELGSILILLQGFPEAIGIPELWDAIGLDAVEELVAMEEDRFIAAGRDLDTTLSSFWSCILFAIVEQHIKLKFLVQHVVLNWLISNKRRRLFHSSRVKFPLVKMSAGRCLVSM